MSEPLTVLQQKLAEAHGLALAAIDATRKVEALVGDVELRGRLRALRKDAEEMRDRCLLLATGDMRAHARIVHERGADLAGAWFTAGTDPLGAWSFLAMAEAVEVTTWAAVAELAAWALALQQEHLATALSGAVRLAGHETALGPRFG